MRRRDFITLLGGLAAAGPIAAGAERAQRNMPLIGVIWSGSVSAPISSRQGEAFRRGLRDNGFVVGENITLENRYYALDPEKLRLAVGDLVRLNVDLILAADTRAALAAKQATHTIPIVCVVMADPIEDGLVANLARPGGNITGPTFLGPELGPKRLQLLKEAVPAATRFAALQQPKVYGERTMQSMVSELQEKARGLGVDFRLFNASRSEEFDAAFEAMAEWHAEALVTFPGPVFYFNFKRIVELAAIHRLPTVYVFREAVEAGGLMCYGADILELFPLAAKYVAKILRGEKPDDLPVEQPTKFDFIINLKTAKALGLTMSPTLLAAADEVIE